MISSRIQDSLHLSWILPVVDWERPSLILLLPMMKILHCEDSNYPHHPNPVDGTSYKSNKIEVILKNLGLIEYGDQYTIDMAWEMNLTTKKFTNIFICKNSKKNIVRCVLLENWSNFSEFPSLFYGFGSPVLKCAVVTQRANFYIFEQFIDFIISCLYHLFIDVSCQTGSKHESTS